MAQWGWKVAQKKVRSWRSKAFLKIATVAILTQEENSKDKLYKGGGGISYLVFRLFRPVPKNVNIVEKFISIIPFKK